ncbi:flagellar biosynthesis protein FlhF [Gammaproteobacteria bacterium]
MKIRRFFAPDIRQAMRLVREEQGADAVILSNRKVDGGVEIVAAMDFDESLLSPASASDPRQETTPNEALQPSARAAAQIGMFREVAQATAAEAPVVSKSAAPGTLRSIPTAKPSAPATSTPLETRPTTAPQGNAAPVKQNNPAQNNPNLKPAAAPVPASKPASKPVNLSSSPTTTGATTTTPSRIPSNPATTRAPAGTTRTEGGKEEDKNTNRVAVGSENVRRPSAESTHASPRSQEKIEKMWVQDPVLVDMRRDLKELRGLLEHQLSGLAWSETRRRTPIQAQLLRSLTELGLTMNLSRELAGAVALVGDLDTAWRHAMGLLAERLTVEEDTILEQGGVVALLGATGVGKTTTVAKLAAHYAMRHGRERVVLVTTDSYRIGSQEQLRTFARILGVPMRVAADAAELSQTLEGLADCGLVLIDTAGMSHRDLRLSEQFATLRGAGRGIRSYLVLSAITQRAGLEEVIRAFSEMNIAGCIMTKLDEAASLGEIISVVIRHQLPVSYLGVGQRVPEDLLPARAHNLVSRAVALLQNNVPDIEEESLAMAFGNISC